MCATCGCDGDGKTTLLNLQTGAVKQIAGAANDAHEHVHADGTRHSHPHDGLHADGRDHGRDVGSGHDHAHPDYQQHGYESAGEVLSIESRILAKNDALASRNRAWLMGREILALNLVSSPGSGKTTLLERTIAEIAAEFPLFVIEGDQATANDGARIRKAGAPVVQVNTGTGCHLDADMVAKGLAELKPRSGGIVFVENVGNLVCPAFFDLGERAKVIIFSTTEGEDKPLKYPHMFRAASLVILNKIDLIPHLDFALGDAVENLHRVNPAATLLLLSARTGEGLPKWYDWVRAQALASRQFSFV